MLTAGLVALLVAVCLDVLIGTHPFLSEGTPALDPAESVISAVTALGCALVVAGFALQPTDAVVDSLWRGWGVVRWYQNHHTALPVASLSVKALAVWGVLAIAAATVLLFIVSPRLYSVMSREDHLVETISALILFVAAGCLLAAVRRLRRRGATTMQIVVGVGIVLGTLLIALEEISWFQRYVGIDTPELFAANMQNEMNLHNFASDFSEVVYYNGAVLALIIVPFVAAHLDHGVLRLPAVRTFLPSQIVVFASVPFVAHDYDTWPVLLSQISFFATAFIVVHYLRVAMAQREGVALLGCLLIFLVVSQVMFIALGHRFVREWEVTEYKELLIPLAMLVYAYDVMHRASDSADI